MKTLCFNLLISCCLNLSAGSQDLCQVSLHTVSDTVLDSKMSLDEALKGRNIPAPVKKKLDLIDVEYYSLDNKLHKGQILADRALASEIKEIFKEIKENKFPIAKVIPVSRYNWSDSLSMKDNNTSCFNYRTVKGTRVLSAHALGRGIDINPLFNPQIKNGKSSPENAKYRPGIPGTITPFSIVVKAFTRKGWKWGGHWKSTKDYQHFEKK